MDKLTWITIGDGEMLQMLSDISDHIPPIRPSPLWNKDYACLSVGYCSIVDSLCIFHERNVLHTSGTDLV